MQYTSEKGCKSAHSDAHHDFPAKYKKELINEYIPTSKYQECSRSEDQFFKEYILESNDPSMLINTILSPDSNTSEIKPIDDKFQQNIRDKYVIVSVKRSSTDDSYKRYHPPNASKKNRSFIEEILRGQNLTDDIFFIGDTTDPNIMDDLASVKDSNFYWVQNAQTLYDPAGKTSYHTDAGKDYGFRNPNSKFTFCWETFGSGYTLYPHWKEKVDVETIDNSNKEIMFYTNRDIYMAIEKKDIRNINTDDYSNHDSGILITYPKTPGTYAYANSSFAEINSTLTSDVHYNQRSALFKDLIANLIASKQSALWKTLQNKNMTNKFLAKRLGDSGQSLSCLRDKIRLQRYENKASPSKIINFVSNQLLAFISFDKLAIAFSILYGTPIIIQSIREQQSGVSNKSSGFIVYIRKDLLDPVKSIKSVYDTDMITQNVQKFKDFNQNILDLNQMRENMIRFTAVLKTFTLTDVSDRNANNNYSLLLSVYMKYINVFQLSKIIKFNEIDFDLETIKTKLLEILNFSVTNLNEIEGITIPPIRSEDINNCFSNLNDTTIRDTLLSEIYQRIDKGKKKNLFKYAKSINSIITRLNSSLNNLFDLYKKQIDIMTSINAIIDTIPNPYTPDKIKELKIKVKDITPYSLCVRFSDRGNLEDKLNVFFALNDIESIFNSFDYNLSDQEAFRHFVDQIKIFISQMRSCVDDKGTSAIELVNTFSKNLTDMGFFNIPEKAVPEDIDIDIQSENDYRGSPIFIAISKMNKENGKIDEFDISDDESSLERSNSADDMDVSSETRGRSIERSTSTKNKRSKSESKRSKSESNRSKSAKKIRPNPQQPNPQQPNPQQPNPLRLSNRSANKGGALLLPEKRSIVDFIKQIFSINAVDLNIIQSSIDTKNVDMGFPKFKTVRQFYRSLYDFEIFLHGFMRLLILMKTEEIDVITNNLEEDVAYLTFPNSQVILKNIYEYLYSSTNYSLNKVEEANLIEYVNLVKNDEISTYYDNSAEKLFFKNTFTFENSVNMNQAIYNYINHEDERLTPEMRTTIQSMFGIKSTNAGPSTIPFPEEARYILNLITNENYMKRIKILMNAIFNYNITTFDALRQLVEPRPTILDQPNMITGQIPVKYIQGFNQPPGKVAPVYGGKGRKTRKIKQVNRQTHKNRV